jgi:uncharacterized protein YktB (UPF0637 family)
MITLQNPSLENGLQNMAESLKIDSKTLLEKITRDFLIAQDHKKAEQIAQNVKDGYLEVQEARRTGKKLQNAWDLLDEL